MYSSELLLLLLPDPRSGVLGLYCSEPLLLLPDPRPSLMELYSSELLLPLPDPRSNVRGRLYSSELPLLLLDPRSSLLELLSSEPLLLLPIQFPACEAISSCIRITSTLSLSPLSRWDCPRVANPSLLHSHPKSNSIGRVLRWGRPSVAHPSLLRPDPKSSLVGRLEMGSSDSCESIAPASRSKIKLAR